MANNKKDNSINFSALRKIAGLIQQNSDSIYKSTYFSDPRDKQALVDLKSKIDTSIKSIMDTNSSNMGEPNISRMYERIFMNTQNNPEVVNDFKKIFQDNEFMDALTNSYLDNRYIKALDEEIDDILKYFPKLEEALQTLRDNVLSADSFSKDFLNMSDELQTNESIVFSNNIDEMKDNYGLLELTNNIYYNTAKYGEEFMYIVPYDKAIERLMQNKQNNPKNVLVRSNLSENTVIMESSNTHTKDKLDTSDYYKYEESDNNFNVNFEVQNGVIESVVGGIKKAYEMRNTFASHSLYEQFLMEQGLYNYQESTVVTEDGTKVGFDHITDSEMEYKGKLPKHRNFDIILDDDLELPLEDDTTSDGLIMGKKNQAKIKRMNGCIVKRLPRDRVTPIYINDICLGYYYFEFDEKANIFEDRYTTTAMNNTITGLRSNGRSEALDAYNRREGLIRYLASELADRIDANFINANQDLKREIYHILKYNDEYCCATNECNNIRCTYIPPEDIQHFYFSLNEKTHRGISDLALSLIPAKLYVAIYTTNCLAAMTRSNDKRVYYVKQSVETNISKTLLKTINEIKKSNFGMRQIENINNVLDITGRFNDYIIPRGPDGSSPIEFEVMPGQQIDIKTDLLNLLEEAAINVTGVPIELIQNRQSPEYAIQLTMQNSKFLRFVYGRQSSFQTQLSKFYTRIYNMEYGNTDKLEIMLPPPLFINITNTNQLIMNTRDYSNTVSEIVLADETNENVKAIFLKDFQIYNLGSYLNMSAINNILNKSRQKAKLLELQNPTEEM